LHTHLLQTRLRRRAKGSVTQIAGIAFAAFAIVSSRASGTQTGGTAMKAELALRDVWVAEHFQRLLPPREQSGRSLQPVGPDAPRKCDRLPFTFSYGGRSSDDLLWSWDFKAASKSLSPTRTRITDTYRDPESGLQVRIEGVVYKNFPTVEWTLYFKNTAVKDTPVLADIKALDVAFSARTATIHHFVGSNAAPNDYEPVEETLGLGQTRTLASAGGRPTNGNLPYFNLESGRGGILAAVSWAGQWSAEFAHTHGEVLVRAGQESTRFILHPGEEVRSPMAVLQFYKGDWVDAQNVWRRWMLAYNVPKADGKPIHPMCALCMGNSYPGIITNAAQELAYLKSYVELGLTPDYWWEDAGWYKCGDPPSWDRTGTWEVDRTRWPKGIREVSDWCRSHGIRTLVWFEPERVATGTWLAEQRPEWILGGKSGGLLNLGLPECRRWLTDHIDSILKTEGIDLYRQDFNIDPLRFWRANDPPDRQGITEIRHVEAYLAYWDELKRRHPGMLIDSCASGGRRNDLETLRRAVPLLRSDYTFEPVGEQCHAYGISFWMPYSGTGSITADPYLIRSLASPWLTLGVDVTDKSKDWSPLKRLVAQWKRLSSSMLGDYYPLTPYSKANDVWMAWQFDRPDLGQGFFQAFRRADCPVESLTVKLRGLVPSARYEVLNVDGGPPMTLTGRALMAGFVVSSPTKPAALVFSYSKPAAKTK
jgi:alpha-galactosidase